MPEEQECKLNVKLQSVCNGEIRSEHEVEGAEGIVIIAFFEDHSTVTSRGTYHTIHAAEAVIEMFEDMKLGIPVLTACVEKHNDKNEPTISIVDAALLRYLFD